MSINFYHDISEHDSPRPKVGLFWLHFNGGPPGALAQRNKYRVRHGLPKIIDEGRCFILELWLGNRTLGLNWNIRQATATLESI